ncbi:MAG TPA: PhoH family protein, partial [Dehalococcoidia bacterium]|nr:PhoH family protein [Dehalococcoidia bacterium]
TLGVQITARDGRVVVKGAKPRVLAAKSVLERLIELAQRGEDLTGDIVADIISQAGQDEDHPAEAWDGRLNVYAGGKPVRAQTPHQEAYLRAIRDYDLVFAIGPAGTGKTYLAVAAAVHLLKTGRVKRVILSRPAVEAGERLGYLPGDVRAKVNPYLRPLFDALTDMMDYGTLRRFMESDVIEVSPLAFMRGRTLNNAVIILDEAQNATRGQMKMILTRMGRGSKMVVTGDITQVDLPDTTESGLWDAVLRLRNTEGVGYVAFDRSDVVRHALVQRIIDAYGGDEEPPRRRPRRRAEIPVVEKADNSKQGVPAESMEADAG